MSRLIIKKKSSSIPIKNKYKYNYSVPFSNFSKYLFDLKIIFKNNNQKNFRKIQNKKKAELISLMNNIKYDTIEKFEINIIILPHGIDKIYTLNGTIDSTYNTSTKSNNYIYIEFTKNIHGYNICTCQFLGQPLYNLSHSPSL